MSTGADIEARIRRHLQEASEGEWSPAQLLAYATDAYLEIWGHLLQIPRAGWGVFEEEFTIAASTETFDLSTLDYFTNNAGTTLSRLEAFWHVVSGDPVPVREATPGGMARLRSSDPVGATVTPEFYLQRQGGSPLATFLPTANGTRTFRVMGRYDPPELASGTTLETPRRYDALIGYMAAEAALADEGQSDDHISATVTRLKLRMIDHEHNSQGAAMSQGTPETVSLSYWQS